MNNEREFLTVQELSDKVRVHPNTIRRAIKDGRIQAFRVGIGSKSSYRIPNTEVQRLCELDMTKLIQKIMDEKLEEKAGIKWIDFKKQSLQ